MGALGVSVTTSSLKEADRNAEVTMSHGLITPTWLGGICMSPILPPEANVGARSCSVARETVSLGAFPREP